MVAFTKENLEVLGHDVTNIFEIVSIQAGLTDEELDIPDKNVRERAAYYEMMQIDPTADQNPAEILLDILEGLPDLKAQAIALARNQCMNKDQNASLVPLELLSVMHFSSIVIKPQLLGIHHMHCLEADSLGNFGVHTK